MNLIGQLEDIYTRMDEAATCPGKGLKLADWFGTVRTAFYGLAELRSHDCYSVLLGTVWTLYATEQITDAELNNLLDALNELR